MPARLATLDRAHGRVAAKVGVVPADQPLARGRPCCRRHADVARPLFPRVAQDLDAGAGAGSCRAVRIRVDPVELRGVLGEEDKVVAHDFPGGAEGAGLEAAEQAEVVVVVKVARSLRSNLFRCVEVVYGTSMLH